MTVVVAAVDQHYFRMFAPACVLSALENEYAVELTTAFRPEGSDLRRLEVLRERFPGRFDWHQALPEGARATSCQRFERAAALQASGRRVLVTDADVIFRRRFDSGECELGGWKWWEPVDEWIDNTTGSADGHCPALPRGWVLEGGRAIAELLIADGNSDLATSFLARVCSEIRRIRYAGQLNWWLADQVALHRAGQWPDGSTTWRAHQHGSALWSPYEEARCEKREGTWADAAAGYRRQLEALSGNLPDSA